MRVIIIPARRKERGSLKVRKGGETRPNNVCTPFMTGQRRVIQATEQPLRAGIDHFSTWAPERIPSQRERKSSHAQYSPNQRGGGHGKDVVEAGLWCICNKGHGAHQPAPTDGCQPH